MNRMRFDQPWKPEAVARMLAGVMVAWSLGILVANVLGRLLHPEAPNTVRFYHFLITAVSLHGVTLVLTHWLLKQHQMSWAQLLGLGPPGLSRALGFAVAAGVMMTVGALLLNKGSAWLLEQVQVQATEQPTVKLLQVSLSWTQRLALGLGAMVLAPVVEEILFRGVLFRALCQVTRPWVAGWASALVFAAIHTNLLTFVPLVFIGLVLAWVYATTGRLVAAMLTHALFNAVNFLLLTFQQDLIRWVEVWRDRI